MCSDGTSESYVLRLVDLSTRTTLSTSVVPSAQSCSSAVWEKFLMRGCDLCTLNYVLFTLNLSVITSSILYTAVQSVHKTLPVEHPASPMMSAG